MMQELKGGVVGGPVKTNLDSKFVISSYVNKFPSSILISDETYFH